MRRRLRVSHVDDPMRAIDVTLEVGPLSGTSSSRLWRLAVA
jgi:hypothetical protein